MFITRNGQCGRGAPAAYGPPKTLDNRWKRGGEAGVAAAETWPKTVMIDATYLRAGTASNLRVKKEDFTA